PKPRTTAIRTSQRNERVKISETKNLFTPMQHDIILTRTLEWSGVLRRRLIIDNSFGQWLADASRQPVTRQTIVAWHLELARTLAAGHDSVDTTAWIPPDDIQRQILRRLRERVFFTLMIRDINQDASLREVVTAT